MPLFDNCGIAEMTSKQNAFVPEKTSEVKASDNTTTTRGRERGKMRETVRDTDVPLTSEAGLQLKDIEIDEVRLWEVEHLGKNFPSDIPIGFENVMGGTDYTKKDKAQRSSKRDAMRVSTFIADSAELSKALADADDETDYNKLIGEKECVLADLVRVPGGKTTTKAYVRAGPRRDLHFYPENVNAAIVTCGGLCPGLNNCIREVTRTLISMYGIRGKGKVKVEIRSI